MTLVAFDHASFSYGDGRVLTDISMAIDKDSFVGLVGPSGAGKTTLLRAMLRQIRPVSGDVRLGDKGLRVGYVPQLEAINWNFPITVAEVVHLGRAVESGPWPWPRRSDRRDVHALLERLGIADFGKRHIRELSGGQQQRVFLARALIRRPDLLLLDEPTAGVDVRTRREVLDLLRTINADGVAIVLTTHDLNAVAANLPDVVFLNRRVIARGRPDEVFTPDVLRATFDSEMLVLRHGDAILSVDAPSAAGGHAHHVHIHHDHEEDVAG
jgi:ABC-type Mn2+/Zn2+ transport system ATPase subunit